MYKTVFKACKYRSSGIDALITSSVRLGGLEKHPIEGISS